MKFLIPFALLMLAPSAGSAQEAISTAPANDAGPPVDAPSGIGGEEDPGDWARRVLAGQPAPVEPTPATSCRTAVAHDGRPHGQVWVGAGTRGYREIGGVVTQQIGKCGSVTIAVSKTEGPRWRGRR
jgi:hypothetical protein